MIPKKEQRKDHPGYPKTVRMRNSFYHEIPALTIENFVSLARKAKYLEGCS
jgi:hypothetical protein